MNRLWHRRYLTICLFHLTVIGPIVAQTDAATAIRIEPRRHAGSDDLIEAVITCQPAPEPGALARFNLTVAFDTTLLALAQVLPVDSYDLSWSFAFIIQPADGLDRHNCLILRSRRPTSYLPGAGSPDSVLARIVFRPLAPSPTDSSTPVSFFWSDCHDNLLLAADHPLYLVSAAARDADGADISSHSVPPPTTSGLCNDCLPFLTLADTTVDRSLIFESGRLPLDLSTAVADSDPDLQPDALTLDPNFPNPFNAGTTIRFSCPLASPWALDICDILGRTIRSFSGRTPDGHVIISWDGRDRTGSPAASGVYLYRLTADRGMQTRKMLLLK